MKKQEPEFDKAELEYLKEGLKRTYKERFEMATRLYKIQQTMIKPLYHTNRILPNKRLWIFLTKKY